MTSETWSSVGILVGGFSTLAIFSFLIKENAYYRFFEHLFIGIAAGLSIVISIKNFLWPVVLVPMLGMNISIYPDGTQSELYNPMILLNIIPMLIGLCYYTIYSPKYNWLAKMVIGISLGAAGGLAFKGFFNEMIPQLLSSFKPLVVYEGSSIDIFGSFSNILFIVTLISVMVYFLFTIKLEGVVANNTRKLGRVLMMVCFGAFFGSTVMARMALLVERIQFLMNDWFGVITTWLV